MHRVRPVGTEWEESEHMPLAWEGRAPCQVWLGEQPLGLTLPTIGPASFGSGWAPPFVGKPDSVGHSGQSLSLCFCVPDLGHRSVGGAVRRLSGERADL